LITATAQSFITAFTWARTLAGATGCRVLKLQLSWTVKQVTTVVA
jgi:hypothetical protein